MADPTQTPAWSSLRDHAKRMKERSIREMFARDPSRADRFSLTVADVFFDYSKNLITDETMALLCQLAEECELPRWIDLMFSGMRINETEGRAVLHTALRNRSDRPVLFDGQDVMPGVQEVLAQMASNEARSTSHECFHA